MGVAVFFRYASEHDAYAGDGSRFLDPEADEDQIAALRRDIMIYRRAE